MHIGWGNLEGRVLRYHADEDAPAFEVSGIHPSYQSSHPVENMVKNLRRKSLRNPAAHASMFEKRSEAVEKAQQGLDKCSLHFEKLRTLFSDNQSPSGEGTNTHSSGAHGTAAIGTWFEVQHWHGLARMQHLAQPEQVPHSGTTYLVECELLHADVPINRPSVSYTKTEGNHSSETGNCMGPTIWEADKMRRGVAVTMKTADRDKDEA
ncbi:hypothetical protein B0H10DRAFT_1953263 [Mycena sp. CBHHK59/15]|nr:hypothetical protein B0H10DRAFT_1953263 [Mycena sp. CBHHK59/15]